MKYLAFIFFLFLSISALAQVEGVSISNNHVLKLHFSDTSMRLDKLYVILNGEEYKGNIESIDADSIVSIDVLRPADAQRLYSEKAANGAILIKTKTNRLTPIRCVVTIPNQSSPLIIVNNVICKCDISSINPEAILKMDILKATQAEAAIYGTSGRNGVVIITTIEYAKQQYQNKLSSFSTPYKNYLSIHKNDDSKLSYVLNGKLIGNDSKSISLLFDLPKSKITNVNVLKEFQGYEANLIVITSQK